MAPSSWAHVEAEVEKVVEEINNHHPCEEDALALLVVWNSFAGKGEGKGAKEALLLSPSVASSRENTETWLGEATGFLRVAVAWLKAARKACARHPCIQSSFVSAGAPSEVLGLRLLAVDTLACAEALEAKGGVEGAGKGVEEAQRVGEEILKFGTHFLVNVVTGNQEAAGRVLSEVGFWPLTQWAMTAGERNVNAFFLFLHNATCFLPPDCGRHQEADGMDQNREGDGERSTAVSSASLTRCLLTTFDACLLFLVVLSLASAAASPGDSDGDGQPAVNLEFVAVYLHALLSSSPMSFFRILKAVAKIPLEEAELLCIRLSDPQKTEKGPHTDIHEWRSTWSRERAKHVVVSRDRALLFSLLQAEAVLEEKSCSSSYSDENTAREGLLSRESVLPVFISLAESLSSLLSSLVLTFPSPQLPDQLLSVTAQTTPGLSSHAPAPAAFPPISSRERDPPAVPIFLQTPECPLLSSDHGEKRSMGGGSWAFDNAETADSSSPSPNSHQRVPNCSSDFPLSTLRVFCRLAVDVASSQAMASAIQGKEGKVHPGVEEWISHLVVALHEALVCMFHHRTLAMLVSGRLKKMASAQGRPESEAENFNPEVSGVDGSEVLSKWKEMSDLVSGRDLLRLLSGLVTASNGACRDFVRADGVRLVLCSTVADEEDPLLKEAAVFAVRCLVLSDETAGRDLEKISKAPFGGILDGPAEVLEKVRGSA
uniref:Ataxin-10 domain-containing protein n=1 Tax=Chromera velia CCMP2878 TaxID=1169474 RepID=A0A0G4ICN1_9ALVE|eukprot:Cvel_13080.t1-p1 / transcript=Cvel_13080.t1 / gene=Cvel_13080 / organism=Chromera_velia_CCMP2878 / gene_product=hypothetical protein / transcript_product=hypothetical protein / location=Cvel_scaffold881:282-4205(+) / protein_length=713 / sequence_SO=supercontig / SO=protein_coding / is_pseudo=false